MAGIDLVDAGVLMQRWDDELRTYTDFRVDPPDSRPYTPGENADADARVQAINEAMNAEQITDDLDQALIDMQAIIDSDNATINQNPAGEIKDMARVLKKIIRKVNELYDGTE